MQSWTANGCEDRRREQERRQSQEYVDMQLIQSTIEHSPRHVLVAASLKESKPKILNTVDYVIANLQADNTVKPSEWQAVAIAREVLAACSIQQLSHAVERVAKKVGTR